ncbi:VOC family protein [Sphingomonas alpina]|uniref:VOC family protein n=1 Tax=Sphingomonas alpina TaxID=653931 RepID=A0A7H0LG54_9SPHN|nr:VOC family protein [Sphingomonas alpina]QNQ08657.1 VOC family protein [Sphingomonas alpina]
MRKLSWAMALAALCCTSPVVARGREPAPALRGQITFLYYKDLPAAARFYERLLGRAPDSTPDWVRLFPLTSTATIGLVNATGGALRPSGEKPVMVTMVVDGTGAIDRWYDRVRAQGIRIVEERKTTRIDARRSIHAFMFNDPEGYRIEILSWVRTPRG